MRSLVVMLLALVLVTGCERVRRAKQHWESARKQATRDQKIQNYYDRLRPLERATLEPFGSDAALFRYLDTMAYMLRGGPDSYFLHEVPSLPEDPPSRHRAAGPGPLIPHYGQMMTHGPFPEEPQRLLEHNGRVYSLHDNTLRSFELDRDDNTLRELGKVTLGSPAPVRRAKPPAGSDRRLLYAGEVVGSYRGVAQYDYLFATSTELVVVGARWDTESIAVERVSIADDGSLRHSSSHSIHLRRGDMGTYRARLSDGTLILFAQPPAFYDDTVGPKRTLVYAIPSVGDANDASGRVHTLLRGRDVQQPLVHADDLVLHVLARCELDKPGLDCSAKAVVAPGTLDFLVGRDAVYLWITGWRPEGMERAGTFLYRMPFDGGAPTTARVASGETIDLKGGLHETEGKLHALIGVGDSLKRIDVPANALSSKLPQLSSRHIHPIHNVLRGWEDPSLALTERHLLFDEGRDKHWQAGTFVPSIRALPLDATEPFEVQLGHAPSLAMPIRDHALVVGSDAWNLHLSVVALSASAGRVVAKHVIRNAVRDLAYDYDVHMLAGVGDGGWFLVQVRRRHRNNTVEPPPVTLLPFHWNATRSTIDAAPEWTVPNAPRREFQQYPGRIDVLSVGSDVLVLRVQDQLLVQHFTPTPTLTQQLTFEP